MDLSRLRSFDDLTAAQRETLATAARTGNVPVELELVVRARNPSINSTTAELFALDWLLLLNERETTTGKLDRRVQILPGREVPPGCSHGRVPIQHAGYVTHRHPVRDCDQRL